MDKISFKRRYFQDNPDSVEVKASAELTTIGEFQNIDELEDELWILQCPKGFDLAAKLKNQKLKLPGRTHLDTNEVVAVEFVKNVTHTYGYCNSKGRYGLRRLPVRGNIFLRDRLLAEGEVTQEVAEALCPKSDRAPMPEFVKVRHPLHGHQFDKRLRVDKEIAERLKKADEITAQILHEARLSQTAAKSKDKKLIGTKKSYKAKTSETGSMSAIHINSAEDDDVEFVSEGTSKKKKKKRKHSESIVESIAQQTQEDQSIGKKKKKSKKSNVVEDVSADLQWLQNL